MLSINYHKSNELYRTTINFATSSHDIQNYNWQQLSTINDMEEMYTTVLEKMIYKNTKTVKSKQNPKKPWLNEQLIRHIRYGVNSKDLAVKKISTYTGNTQTGSI
ncbi:hypothetical protein JTB14_025358 [Gonioctena quinquepunctata]|nr:hypothetical protein JTB14_025358 [Gonioctena quinquepunctata]